MERRREARTWLEADIPDAVSTAFFGIQLSAIVLRCRKQLHGAATKTFLFLQLRLGPVVLLATYAIGPSLPQSDFFQTLELLMCHIREANLLGGLILYMNKLWPQEDGRV